MTWAHIHLALNHVPVVGLPVVVLLLAWGVVRRSPEVTRASLGLLVLLAAVTIVVQLTGEPAEDLVEGLPGVFESGIERHEEAALIGSIGMTALGLLGCVALSVYFGWVANLGGQIRHSEIRPTAQAAARAAERDD
jgi:hypothetical protein